MPIPRFSRLIALVVLLVVMVCPGAWGAVDFSGDADRIADTSNVSITTHPITISFWINLSSASLQGSFINIGDPSAVTGDGLGVGVGNGTFENTANVGNELIILYNTKRWIDTNDNIGTGWHHIAVTVNSSGYCEAWIDGTEVYTEGSGTSPAVNYDNLFYIGGYLVATYDRYVDATINEVALWNTVLTDSEIIQLSKSRVKRTPLQIKPANLKAYYPLDEASDGTNLSTITDFYKDIVGGFNCTGVDANGNSRNVAETVLSYPGDE